MKTTRSAPDLQRVALGDPGVADLSIDGSTITLVGLSPGQTNVLRWEVDCLARLAIASAIRTSPT